MKSNPVNPKEDKIIITPFGNVSHYETFKSPPSAEKLTRQHLKDLKGYTGKSFDRAEIGPKTWFGQPYPENYNQPEYNLPAAARSDWEEAEAARAAEAKKKQNSLSAAAGGSRKTSRR
jgi:hypothetical protein